MDIPAGPGESIYAVTVWSGLVWAALLIPLIWGSLWMLVRRQDCAVEIAVIWYAFSLVFVIWLSIRFAVALDILQMPWIDPDGPKLPNEPTGSEPARWTALWIYHEARDVLTNKNAEIGFVSAVLIVGVTPQWLSYVLAGLCGSASTPKYVWAFEKFAIWSAIKFLAGLGGLFFAEAFDWMTIYREDFAANAGQILRGLTAIGFAFVIALLQAYFINWINAAEAAVKNTKTSWPLVVHDFFIRNVPPVVKDEVDPVILAAAVAATKQEFPWLPDSAAEGIARAGAVRMQERLASIVSSAGILDPTLDPKASSRGDTT